MQPNIAASGSDYSRDGWFIVYMLSGSMGTK